MRPSVVLNLVKQLKINFPYDEIKVLGHGSADVDSVSSSAALTELLKRYGVNAVSYTDGRYDDQTKFVLKYFPYDLKQYKSFNSKDILIFVDHGDIFHPGEGRNVIAKVDHHFISLNDLNCPNVLPGCNIMMKTGSCATIVYEMYKAVNVIPARNIAGLLMGGILSDTLALSSVNVTKYDLINCDQLSRICGIKDYKTFGMNLLKAAMNYDDKTDREVYIDGDMAVWSSQGLDFNICVINVAGEEMARKMTIRTNRFYTKLNPNVMFLTMIKDVIANGSTIVVHGYVMKRFFEDTYKVRYTDPGVFLKGVTSRKKQVAPQIGEWLNSHVV